MLHDLLRDLNHEQKTELYRRHITQPLISAWRTGKRLPTEVQVVDLAEVAGADWAELQKEITVLRAPEDRRQHIAGVLRWRERNSSKV
jgi:hypothetical protein